MSILPKLKTVVSLVFDGEGGKALEEVVLQQSLTDISSDYVAGLQPHTAGTEVEPETIKMEEGAVPEYGAVPEEGTVPVEGPAQQVTQSEAAGDNIVLHLDHFFQLMNNGGIIDNENFEIGAGARKRSSKPAASSGKSSSGTKPGPASSGNTKYEEDDSDGDDYDDDYGAGDPFYNAGADHADNINIRDTDCHENFSKYWDNFK